MSLSKYALRGKFEQLLGDNPNIHLVDSTNSLVAHVERSTNKAFNTGKLEKGLYREMNDLEDMCWDEACWDEWKDPIDKSKDHNPRRVLTPDQNKARLKKIKASKRARRRNR